MLGLTRDRASVAPDAQRLVDDESVLHRRCCLQPVASAVRASPAEMGSAISPGRELYRPTALASSCGRWTTLDLGPTGVPGRSCQILLACKPRAECKRYVYSLSGHLQRSCLLSTAQICFKENRMDILAIRTPGLGDTMYLFTHEGNRSSRRSAARCGPVSRSPGDRRL